VTLGTDPRTPAQIEKHLTDALGVTPREALYSASMDWDAIDAEAGEKHYADSAGELISGAIQPDEVVGSGHGGDDALTRALAWIDGAAASASAR
jgi:hypothetical protein